MKTKSGLQWLLPVAIASITITGCKKTDEVDFTEEYTAQTDDQMLVSTEVDMVANDANVAVESTASFFNRNAQTPPICDGVITEQSTLDSKIITIQYDGVHCSAANRRKGTVVITMPAGKKFSDPGAELNIMYYNLEITRLGDKKRIVLNGQLFVKNVSGGRLSQVAGKNIVHDMSSPGLDITFPNGKKLTWHIAVRRTYSFDNGMVITTTGNHTHNNVSNISEWGETPSGKFFYSVIEEPMVIRQDCQFRLVSAKLVQHQRHALTISFGLDAYGNKTGCPGAGNYYMKVAWQTDRNHSKYFIKPY